MTSKTLVVYYSWSGTTRRVAQVIAAQAGADLVELTVAENTFPREMNATFETAQRQMATGNLPALTNSLPDLGQYATLLVGGPVWGAKVATPVRRFLQQLTGYAGVVAPFYTDAGTPGDYQQDFAGLVSGPLVRTGLEAQPTLSPEQVTAWLAKIKN
ncbi:flavodoxin family protein [Levilactobacillus namurensis]|uniref:flavodoxin family protein n=1 Tax=Levilactobacillus namurensis TaxID=380393 RepID=UPI00222E285B|nr:flavodoxin [Levilactobacillus namurensis]MCW3778809.1 flavodoxin [Levilactobacillus namurensis]MDT7019383.1 flavodoxin [Levilactobacillus namurensis]WNN66020.1 flavodoxin [Levilactobacillus namurensis]